MHLLEVLVEEAVHNWVCTNGGHRQEVATGVYDQQHAVALRRVTAAHYIILLK